MKRFRAFLTLLLFGTMLVLLQPIQRAGAETSPVTATSQTTPLYNYNNTVPASTYPLPATSVVSQPAGAPANLSPVPAPTLPTRLNSIPGTNAGLIGQTTLPTPTAQGSSPATNISTPATPGTLPAETASVPPKTTTPDATAEISSIERAMQDSVTNADKTVPQPFSFTQLAQFGYNYFRPESQGFAALSDIPVGPDYILGSGDRIALTLWGSIEGTYELEVNRSGEITLPRVGTVKVSGVRFGQLPALLNGQLAKVFKDFQFTLTMGKLRLIKVYVVGEVQAPGDYSVSSLSTLINALAAAGGPTKNGSLRSIAIRRDSRVIETVDLYEFFLKGDKSRDIRLQPGDIVFVPNIGPVAGIAGNVRRPAIYELKGEKTLKELLALAGGIIPTGYLQRLQISRVDAHDKKVVTDVHLDPKSSEKTLDEQTGAIPIQDMDLVKIFPIDSTLRGYARLEGYVLRPGDYALQPGMRVDQLLSKDNLLPEYYADAGQVIRLYPPDYHPEVLYFNINSALAKDPANNLELHEFDTIRIFSRWEMEEMPRVRINGEIQRPGEYRLFRNMRVRDLLMFAGNPRQTAYLSTAEITRINRTTSSVTSCPINISLEEALKGNPSDNILLQPYDELTVRKIPNWAEENERYITLKGEFVFPGTYPIFKGERLSSVIRRAGGFTPKAYLHGAKFTRASVRELQQKRMDEFLSNAELEVNTKMTELATIASSQEELASAKATLEGVRRNLQLLKAAKAEGRMVIHLPALDQFAGSPYDIEVMGGDTLEVPQSTSSVAVLGRVVNPTSFIHIDEKDVAYYLNLAGGTTLDSDEDGIYVIRADGSIFSRQQYSSLASIFGGGFLNEQIAAGDAIVVPQRFERTAWLRNIKEITTIMSQIAVTAGTVLLGLR